MQRLAPFLYPYKTRHDSCRTWGELLRFNKEKIKMQCQNCGSQIDDVAKFCPSCGKPTKPPHNESEPSSNSVDLALYLKGNLDDLKNNLQKIELTDVWELLILGILKLPKIRVDRKKFLQEKFSKLCKKDQLESLVNGKPSDYVKPHLIVKVANECIEARHKDVNSWLTHIANFALDQTPMGKVRTVLKWFNIDFSPSDFGTYYFNLIKVAQELAYLYGFQELFDENGKPLNGTVDILTTFIAATFECESAKAKILPFVSKNVLTRNPNESIVFSIAEMKLDSKTLKGIIPSMIVVSKKNFYANVEILSTLFQLATFNEIIKVKKGKWKLWLCLILLVIISPKMIELVDKLYGIDQIMNAISLFIK